MERRAGEKAFAEKKFLHFKNDLSPKSERESKTPALNRWNLERKLIYASKQINFGFRAANSVELS